MNYKQIIEAWNAQADEYNQWDDLGEDEKVEFAARAGAAGWRTIDSAPKDGRSFDVWVKSTKNPDYGVRLTGVYYVQGVLCGSRFPNSSWGEYASHWMPLPAAPKEQQ